ncbi:iron(III) transport system permease protein [Stella humosa]|uniref:Iron(III) transport system permease protein n=1 Tax=Stella humosa TaxID=94 RepID=A0A3N1KVQ4_9PROT|nr:iron ABC transporter permease [Stella humosa]ROP84024.1 iron(III) transport system permease protein [Stella humosa]BBK33533.1 ABC transporter substrate-binding protein [Stella humosa]
MADSGTLAAGPGRPSWATRLRHFDPTILVWLLLAAVLVFLVVNPLLRLVLTSFAEKDTGVFTLANYAAAYGRPRYVQALWNSVLLGAAVSVLCLVLAVPLAWGVSRTDMPGKGLVRLLVLGTFITPPYLGAIGWILLAGPNAGWINRIWRGLTGAEDPLFDIYSFPGLTLIIALYSFPYLFIFVSAALDLVSSEMEDAASILGAGKSHTTFRITLPLVLPAILGGLIITFLEAIALFGSPALIALPARFNVVTTQLWQFFSHPARVEVAAAFAMPLLLVTIALFWVQQRIIRRRGFVALTGKGGERRPMQLGRWRWLLFAYALLVLTLAVILPYLILGQAAFAKAWGRGFSFDNLTLGNFHFLLFQHATARQSVVNSFLYAGATACIAISLALAIAYIVQRRLVPFGGVLSFLCMAPFVIPGIVLAIGFYAAYAPPPLSLYGTAWILILAFTTRFLPIAFANASASIRSINPEMEDAVRILGGSRLTAVTRVVVPLLKSGLVGAWLLVFIPATRELSAAIFLYGPDTRTMAVMLFDLSEEGNFERLAALGWLLLAATIAIVAVGYRIVGRDFMLRRGGSD